MMLKGRIPSMMTFVTCWYEALLSESTTWRKCLLWVFQNLRSVILNRAHSVVDARRKLVVVGWSGLEVVCWGKMLFSIVVVEQLLQWKTPSLQHYVSTQTCHSLKIGRWYEKSKRERCRIFLLHSFCPPLQASWLEEGGQQSCRGERQGSCQRGWGQPRWGAGRGCAEEPVLDLLFEKELVLDLLSTSPTSSLSSPPLSLKYLSAAFLTLHHPHFQQLPLLCLDQEN